MSSKNKSIFKPATEEGFKSDILNSCEIKSDPPIDDQNFFVFKVINAEDEVTKKNLYNMNDFMVKDINKMILAQGQQMVKKLNVDITNTFKDTLASLKVSMNEDDQLLYKLLNAKVNELKINEDVYLEEARRSYAIDADEIHSRYEIFIEQNYKRLDREYERINKKQLAVHAFKFSGAFPDLAQANARAKEMRMHEPYAHCYVGTSYQWAPLVVNPNLIEDQHYLESGLNELMTKYNENVKQKDMFFEEHKKQYTDDAAKQKQEQTKDRLRKKLEAKKAAHAAALLAKQQSALQDKS